MNSKRPNQIVIQHTRELKKKRSEVLSLPPEEMLNKILSDKNPIPLVHSFPEEDFYFMVHEIGPEDSLPLLSLASDRQMNFILDQEVWQKDRIDLGMTSKWIGLMLEADSSRFRNWLMHDKTDLLEYFLHYGIELRIREHDEDPSDFGEDFFTFDTVFYFKITDHMPEPEGEPNSDDDDKLSVQKDLILKLLEEIAHEDHIFFQKMLLEATHLLPAEAEEDAYRWRNVRLSEKGFLPFDEAIGIYQPLSLDQLDNFRRKIKPKKKSDEEIISTPDSPFDLLKNQKLFSNALAVIDKEEELRQLQTEFAVLCNQIITADQVSVKNRKDLEGIVQKAYGYIHIGLEKISEVNSDNGPSQMLLSYPLASLFSLGFGCALKIKWRAEKWVDESWFKHQYLPLSFWGEQWLGILGGLLIKKPRYYDNYKTGLLYRDFKSLEEIKQTDGILDNIITIDKLLSLINISPGPKKADVTSKLFLSYKNFMLTLWARSYLNLSENLEPIFIKQFEPFYINLWDKQKKPKKVSEHMKSEFLQFLNQKTGLMVHEIADQIGHVLEQLFVEIQEEYGALDYGNIRPRYMYHFLLK